jgi:hypothetical protein
MRETKKTYKENIKKYLNSISGEVDEIIKQCVQYSYSEDVEYVDIIINDGSFIYDHSIAVFAMSEGGSVGDSVGEDIDNALDAIRPRMDVGLDPYDIDFEYRNSVFMEEVQNFFSNSWSRVVDGLTKVDQMKFYILEHDDDVSWCINTRKKVKVDKKTKG